MNSKTGPTLSRKFRITDLGLFAFAGAICFAIAMWPGGLMQFMQGIAEDGDMLSITLLASLIGVIFVLVFRLGGTVDYAEELSTTET